MNNIHPTAIVSPKAILGDNNIIGPHAIIEDNVEIGNNCNIGPFAVIYPGARIKNNVTIHQSASVANVPQDLSFSGEDTILIIDDNTTIREFAALHRGTKATGQTYIGKSCFIMAYSHVAHDDYIGDHCILANAVQLAGHVHLEDWVTIGGGTVVHQFCNIGQQVMIGGGNKVTQDVPPFVLAADWPLRFVSLNIIGLRRRGFSNENIQTLKQVYGILYNKSYNLSQAKELIQKEFGTNEYAQTTLQFLAQSKRGIIG